MTQDAAPDAITNLQEVESQKTTTGLGFTWEDGQWNGGADITKYIVSYGSQSIDVTEKSVTITRLN